MPASVPFDPTATILVEVVNPEQPFAGVIVEMPSDTVVVSFTGGVVGGSGGDVPVSGAVDSVFGRAGDVLAETGDYSLDQILPPDTVSWIIPGGIRIKPDGSIQLWNPDQSKWHTLQVRGTAGAEYLTIGSGET